MLFRSATDITGFGLLGHSVQMAENSRAGITIFSASVPVFPEAAGFAEQGLCPAGLHRNREFYSPSVIINDKIPSNTQDILFDPQTSGGLLISLAPSKARLLLDKLRGAGVKEAAIIGEVTRQPRGKVTVR